MQIFLAPKHFYRQSYVVIHWLFTKHCRITQGYMRLYSFRWILHKNNDILLRTLSSLLFYLFYLRCLYSVSRESHTRKTTEGIQKRLRLNFCLIADPIVTLYSANKIFSKICFLQYLSKRLSSIHDGMPFTARNTKLK